MKKITAKQAKAINERNGMDTLECDGSRTYWAATEYEDETFFFDTAKERNEFVEMSNARKNAIEEVRKTEEAFEISLHKAVIKIHNIVESDVRTPSDRHICDVLWDMYKNDSCVCAEAVCYAIKGYAESFNWESVRRLSRAMELVKENEI